VEHLCDPRPYLTETNNRFFKEYEIVTEEADKHSQSNPKLEPGEIPEEDEDEDDSESVEEVIDHNKVVEENKALIEKYKEVRTYPYPLPTYQPCKSTRHYAREELTTSDFQLNQIVKDKFLQNFQSIIQQDPEQVLRYYEDKGITPIWMHARHQASIDKIPPCPRCNAPRVCEFQVRIRLEGGRGAPGTGLKRFRFCLNYCTS
jgi:hypothetical protein